MASTNKTKNYKLNQWLGSDYMKRDDLNNDNELIDAALKYNADALSAEAVARTAGDNELRDLVSSEAAARQAADDEINSMIKSGVTMSPAIGLGMNSVIRKTDGITSFPKFTIQGKSYVNLLGRDGNCEDVSKWYMGAGTIALDTSLKVSGSASLKVETNTSPGYHVSQLLRDGSNRIPLSALGFSVGDYIMFSVYSKPAIGGASSNILFFDASNTQVGNVSTGINLDDTAFKRGCVKVQIPANTATITLQVVLLNSGGSSSFTGTTENSNFDGMMLNKITADEYNNLSADQLMKEYPYVDSFACLQKPYIEVRHDNLVRNGNCEESVAWWEPWNSTITMSILNGKFQIEDTVGNKGFKQIISVKLNTDYYLIGNTSGSKINVYDKKFTTLIRTGTGTFNTGNNGEIGLYAMNLVNAPATFTFDSLMIIEGTTAPASYKPCRIERCAIEGKFTSDDTFTYENGEVSGMLNWKHKTLYGKDYDWQYALDFTGSKAAKLVSVFRDGITSSRAVSIKYDGTVMGYQNPFANDTLEVAVFNGVYDFYVKIKDSDSGWAETLSPNADEVKAFMNGWKAVNSYNSRYIAWISIVDGSFPINITTAVGQATGLESLTVVNASNFAVGEVFVVRGTNGTNYTKTISSISGNVLNFTGAITSAISAGATVGRADNGSSIVNTITYCKNNIAPGYEGYQLHYKLQNPEPITDANVHVYGDIPKLANGDNYVYVDSGIVLGEVANPALGNGSSANTTYYINTNNYVNSTWGTPETTLRNRFVEKFIAIYKNQNYDSIWNFGYSTVLEKLLLANTAQSNFDHNSTYTVDYQILKTMHTTPTAITMQYQQDVLSTVADLAEGLNSRQKADSSLDTLVDLTVYEKYDLYHLMGRAIQMSSSDYRILAPITFLPKKCVPIVTITIFGAYYFDGASGFLTIPVSDIQIVIANVTKNYTAVRAMYIGTNSTIKTAILNYGIDVILSLTFDCRGRL